MKKLMKYNFIIILSIIFTVFSCSDDNLGLKNVGLDNFSTTQPGGFVAIESSAAAIDEGASSTITIDLPNPVTSDVTVNFSISGTATIDTDYTVSGATISGGAGSGTIIYEINAGGSDSFSFTITSIYDGVAEADETVVVTLTGATAANGTQIDLGDPTSNPGGDPVIAATVTISDPTVEVSFTGGTLNVNEMVERDTVSIPIIFDVGELAGGTADVTYTVTSANGNKVAGVNYNILSGASPITGISDTTSISLEIIPDGLVDGDTLLFIITAVTPSTGFSASVGDTDSLEVRIIDNLATVAFATDSLVLSEAAAPVATTYLFDIALSDEADADVTVNYSLSAAVAGISLADGGSLTISSGDQVGTAVVSIDPSVFSGMTDLTTSIQIDGITTTSAEVSVSTTASDLTRSITIDNTP